MCKLIIALARFVFAAFAAAVFADDRRRLFAAIVVFFVVAVDALAALALICTLLIAACIVRCIRCRTPATVANYLH